MQNFMFIIFFLKFDAHATKQNFLKYTFFEVTHGKIILKFYFRDFFCIQTFGKNINAEKSVPITYYCRDRQQ